MIVLNTNSPIITTSSGAVMAKGWNEEVPSLHTNTKGDLADEGLVFKESNLSKSYHGEVGSMQKYQDATKDFILNNPDLIIPIIAAKLKSAFNPFPETSRPGILENGRVVYQIISLIAVVCLLFLGNELVRSLVLGLIFSTILITIVTYSGFRFRMPQTGLEILLITILIEKILDRFHLKPE